MISRQWDFKFTWPWKKNFVANRVALEACAKARNEGCDLVFEANKIIGVGTFAGVDAEKESMQEHEIERNGKSEYVCL